MLPHRPSSAEQKGATTCQAEIFPCLTVGDGYDFIHSIKPLEKEPASDSQPSSPDAHCKEGWYCLAVGFFDEACQLSRMNNDVLCWAASLAMCGATEIALKTLEAYIIATCVVVHERRQGMHSSSLLFEQRHTSIMVAWGLGSSVSESVIGGRSRITDSEYRDAVLGACEIIDWDGIHCWFLIALLLHGTKEYTAPKIPWFRYFFSLLHEDQAERTKGSSDAVPGKMHRMNSDELYNALLSQCEKPELNLISAITAWKTRHYRTAITAATEFLDMDLNGYVSTQPHIPLMTCFIRCMCLTAIGERSLAAKDAITILQCKDAFVSAVGSAIISFVLPLQKALDIVKSYNGRPVQKSYVYALCEYVHALTLVQLGSMEAALGVIQSAIHSAPQHDVGEWLQDLLVIVCTALGDSSTILGITLSPHQELYIALCPVFFGGFSKGCGKLRVQTAAGKLLYPKGISTYAHLQQMLPFHMNCAHHNMEHEWYFEAWENVSLAAGYADEIVGSVEFAFSQCSPLHVYYYGCCVGEALLNTLLEIMTAKDSVVKKNGSKNSPEMLKKESVYIATEVVRKCFQWALRIRHFHPHLRLGDVALSRCCTFSRAKNFLGSAISLARRYPGSALAQNSLTLALYTDHRIPEAADHAMKTLQAFPHSDEVVAIHRNILQKNGLYTFNYRTIFPVRYAPGSYCAWSFRNFVVMLLLLLNICQLLLTIVVNLFTEQLVNGALEIFIPHLLISSKWPLFYALLIFIYAALATITKRNLVSTLLQDLFFKDNRLCRFLFAMRGVAFLNVFNAVQITVSGDNFLFESHWYTFFLYFLSALVVVPFTSRIWFLPSLDEPKDSVWTFLTVFGIDCIFALILIVPHLILFAVEPLFFVIFFFLYTMRGLDRTNVRGHVGKRLKAHQAHAMKMNFGTSVRTRSRFIYIRIMALLYYGTHSDLATKSVLEMQIEEDNYRVFPLIEVYEPILTKSIHSIASGRRSRSEWNTFRGLFSTVSRVKNFKKSFLAADSSTSAITIRNNNNVNNRGNVSEEGALKNTSIDAKACSVGRRVEDALDNSTMLNSTLYLDMEYRRRSRKGDSLPSSRQVGHSNGSSSSTDSSNAIGSGGGGDNSGAPVKRTGSGQAKNARDLSSSSGDDNDYERRMLKYSTIFCPSTAGRSTSVCSENNAAEEASGQGLLKRQQKLSDSSPRSSDVRSDLLQLAHRFRSCLVSSNNPLSLGDNIDTPRSCVRSNAKKLSTIPSNAGGESKGATRRNVFKDSVLSSCEDEDERHVDPIFLSDEKAIMRALHQLYDSLMNYRNNDEDTPIVGELQEKKDALMKCLLDMTSSSGSKVILKGTSCRKLCCAVVAKMVESGEDETNPFTRGNVTLVDKMMHYCNTSEIFHTLLSDRLLDHCVKKGCARMLAVILPANCSGVMKPDHWSSLLRLLCLESTPARAASLKILVKAAENVKYISFVTPLFQQAVGCILASGTSGMPLGELEDLLKLFKGEKCIQVNFCQEEGPDGQTIFSRTCASGNLELLTLLWSLDLITEPNRVQSDGTNALMQAVMCNHESIVRWFRQFALDWTRESFLHRHPERGDVLDISGNSVFRSLLKETLEEIQSM